MATARIDSTKAPTTPRTIPHTHHMSTTDATAVLTAWHCHEGEPGGLVIVDTPQGLKAHYTPNPGNIAGRMVMLDTSKPLDPDCRTPHMLAVTVNQALDDNTPADQPTAPAVPSIYTSPRTYETTTLALELANIEPLYTAARRLMARRLAQAGPGDNVDRAEIKADALKEYMEQVMEDLAQPDAPRISLLIALANAASARVDWDDVADTIAADL